MTLQAIVETYRMGCSHSARRWSRNEGIFDVVPAAAAARATSMESLREESKQQYEQDRRRQRIQVCVYGLLMAAFGAFFALQFSALLKS